jgi:uncharacterized protein (TIGR02145 family)
MKNKTYPISLLITGVILITSVSCKKEQKTALINFNSSITFGNMTDQDGNSYKTVVIGNKTWMAENLRTTKYRNGDLIPYISGKETWNVTSGAYCVYDDDINYSNIYGLLYNWYAINDSRNIAPVGWHVATDAEWESLYSLLANNSVEMASKACTQLKEHGTTHWSATIPVQYTGTDDFGFTALPGGFREASSGPPPSSGTYIGIGNLCELWSSGDTTIDGDTEAYGYDISIMIERQFYPFQFGLSVRCVKDSI